MQTASGSGRGGPRTASWSSSWGCLNSECFCCGQRRVRSRSSPANGTTPAAALLPPRHHRRSSRQQRGVAAFRYRRGSPRRTRTLSSDSCTTAGGPSARSFPAGRRPAPLLQLITCCASSAWFGCTLYGFLPGERTGAARPAGRPACGVTAEPVALPGHAARRRPRRCDSSPWHHWSRLLHFHVLFHLSLRCVAGVLADCACYCAFALKRSMQLLQTAGPRGNRSLV